MVLWVVVVVGLVGWGVPIGVLLVFLASLFSGFSSVTTILFRVEIVGVRASKTTFKSRNSSIFQLAKSLRISPDRQSGTGSHMMPSLRLHDPVNARIENG